MQENITSNRCYNDKKMSALCRFLVTQSNVMNILVGWKRGGGGGRGLEVEEGENAKMCDY